MGQELAHAGLLHRTVNLKLDAGPVGTVGGFYLLIYLVFLGPHLKYMEVPRLGGKLEL